jgi:hypothetical protein
MCKIGMNIAHIHGSNPVAGWDLSVPWNGYPRRGKGTMEFLMSHNGVLSVSRDIKLGSCNLRFSIECPLNN